MQPVQNTSSESPVVICNLQYGLRQIRLSLDVPLNYKRQMSLQPYQCLKGNPLVGGVYGSGFYFTQVVSGRCKLGQLFGTN